jgi:hypothetical protein
MAGTIVADTLQSSITGTPVQFNDGVGTQIGTLCRAWVNFDGTTNTGGFCTIRASFNVSSITDNGTGDYTVNFTTAMPDANYSAIGITVSTSTNNELTSVMIDGVNTTYTTTQCRINTKRVNPSGGNFDNYATVNFAVFR